MKIKDKIEDEKEFANKELEASEPKGYVYIDENKKHLHTFNGKSLLGTSTVVGVIAKPLTWWASGLACTVFGWINKGNAKKGWVDKATRLANAISFRLKISKLSDEEYLSLLDDAYKAHSVKLDTSATAGTDLHAELERFVKNHMANRMDTYPDQIMPFILWTEQKVEKFLWSELNCFSETLWVGGISDVGVLLKDGTVGIIDFKSSKESYDTQFIQGAGYDLQITENGGYTSDGNKVFTLPKPITFYGIIPFGADKFTVDFRYNVEELKQGFKSALCLYKILNK